MAAQMSEGGSISQRPVQIPFSKQGWDSANAAMDSLFGLFEDHYPYVISEDDESWVFGLTWPLDPLWYVDPFVSDQARRIFGFSLAELPTLCEVSDCGGIP